ncbi:ATP-dependent DNA helicase RecQ [Bacillaceae bacterium S4-13-58]
MNLQEALQQYFGYKNFREGQKEILEYLQEKKDVLGILPTGTGKSVCYQLPALMNEGLVVVISPLISLMIDQVREMKEFGYKRVASINSMISYQEKQVVLSNLKKLDLLYCSPEMLQSVTFLNLLKQVPIQLIAIDEAHCISQWGHEFRMDYQRIRPVLEFLDHPQVLALSATAMPRVQEEIKGLLGRPRMTSAVFPMDRPNITIVVEQVQTRKEKIEQIKEVVNNHSKSTMIYFSSRNEAERVAVLLENELPNKKIAYYHGGLESNERILIQQQFMKNQLDIICCTNAFGMGINKPDIRLVIHFHPPGNMESYIQEIGRAGRDGEQAVSLLFYSENDERIPKYLIDSEIMDETSLLHAITLLKKDIFLRENLPVDEEIIEILQISEVHWRFLKFHLEKHDMIENRKQLSELEWDQIYVFLKELIYTRKNYKSEKLQEFLEWIKNNECRRMSLYKHFQQKIQFVENKYCCDYCGFSFDHWHEPAKNSATIKEWDWKLELKTIFHIEGQHE